MTNTTQSSQAESSGISSSSVNGDTAVETSTISSPSVNSATVVATTATSSSSTYAASVETTSPLPSLFSTQPASSSATRTPSRVANPSYTSTSKVAISVPSQSNGKFSSGTLAGSIVGAFAGGYILALLAAFLFFRFRKKSRKPREKDRGSGYIKSSEKVLGQTVTTFAGVSKPKNSDIPLPQVASAFESQHLDLSTYIPQPADDHSVCMRIQSLFDQAGLHVENYYSRTASNPPLTRDLLARLSRYDSTSLPVSLNIILSNPRSQRAVLTHVLIESLLHAIQPGETENSLLPADFAASPQQGGSEVADAATERVKFAWRMLTSFLYSSNNHSPALSRENVMKFAEGFTKAFEPYSNPQFTKDDRLRHLATISKSAADLGIWLFSQPCSFKFRWVTDRVSGDNMVVLPAILKVCDEQGRLLAIPEKLVEEKVVQT